MSFIPAEIIKKKRAGKEHSFAEVEFFIKKYSAGELPDSQMAAWLMAICFQGMSDQETAWLTDLMKNSGRVFDFSHLPYRVDKHSTGGVGDKASLILGPIAAANGVNIPMIAGRGLGHTGGTLDKLESIPGFNDRLSFAEFTKNVSEHGLAMMGQTEEICPADRKLYSLRDVTGTIDSLPLICGSIMSKKLAEDLTGLVLDVKFGSGAFMKTPEDAEKLAKLLKSTGEMNGVTVSAFLTSMNQPLGRYAGNSLEVIECLDIMSGENDHPMYAETRELSLQLAAEMILLAKQAETFEQAYEKANVSLQNGDALKQFEALCQRQGNGQIDKIPLPKVKQPVLATREGFLKSMNVEAIGLAGLELGIGRKLSTDKIEPTATIEFTKKIGDSVAIDEPIFILHGQNHDNMAEVSQLLLSAVEISAESPQNRDVLILKKL